MPPDTRTALNTYSSHPWIFKDANTGELMHVNHKEVYWPEPWILTKLTTRSPINIHLPLRTLGETATWIIAGNLSSEESIDRLEIPKKLCEDLKAVFKTMNEYKNSTPS